MPLSRTRSSQPIATAFPEAYPSGVQQVSPLAVQTVPPGHGLPVTLQGQGLHSPAAYGGGVVRRSIAFVIVTPRYGPFGELEPARLRPFIDGLTPVKSLTVMLPCAEPVYWL